MAGLVNAPRNSMLDQLGTLVTFVSLHSADPGTGGTNELTGGSPAYARKAMTWNAAATSSKTGPTGTVTFDVPAGSTVAYLGYWSAASAGTFYGSRATTAATGHAAGSTTVPVSRRRNDELILLSIA